MQTVHAETGPFIPQFSAYSPPHEMPDLAFQDAKGTIHHLSDYHGQLVLLNLWATWCIPCRREMPALDTLQNVFKATKFKILPISMDSNDGSMKILAFFHEQQIKSLPILLDNDFHLLRALHPAGLPTSYLIAPDGRAVGRIEGFAAWDSQEAGNLIEAYLPKP